MARTKKKTELDVHNDLSKKMISHIEGACSETELQLEMISNVAGWLCHIDYCLSIMVDERQKGGKLNALDSQKNGEADAGRV